MEESLSPPVKTLEFEGLKRNWPKILGFILLGLVIAGGIFVAGYYSALKTQSEKVIPPPTSTPTPHPISQVTSIPTPVDSRILLTPENIRQYNGETSEERCSEKFNNDSSSTTVNYSSKESGISLDIPYNPNWGNEKYRINPYDEVITSNKIGFGDLFIGDACGWGRVYSLSFLPARTTEEAIIAIKSKYAQPTISPLFDSQFALWPIKVIINDITVIKYQPWNAVGWATPHLEIIGKKYVQAVEFAQRPIRRDFTVFENIVKTIKFID